MIDQWLVMDIKNTSKKELKGSFIDAVEIINDDKEYGRDYSRFGLDLKARSAERLKEYKKNKEKKFNNETQ